MKKLKDTNPDNVIFLDIETVRSEKELNENSVCYEAWKYKMRNNPEELSMEDSFNDKAALFAPFAKICCITIGKIVKKENSDEEQIKLVSYYGVDEYKLLNDFNNLIIKLYEKNKNLIYCGYNSSHFDFPFIAKRMLVNQIEYHQSIDKYGLKPWDISDIDLADAWKGNSYNQDSLVSLCAALGLKSPKDDISGVQVSDIYYGDDENGLVRIAKYCEKDVTATINVFKKFRFENAIEDIISNLK